MSISWLFTDFECSLKKLRNFFRWWVQLGRCSHNVQYQVTTMYQTGENGVCPKAPRACPNPRRLHISWEPDFSRTWNFQGWFLALFSTISEVLDEFLSVDLKNQFLRCQIYQFFFGKISQTRFFLKIGLCQFQALIVPQLHAKKLKNR